MLEKEFKTDTEEQGEPEGDETKRLILKESARGQAQENNLNFFNPYQPTTKTAHCPADPVFKIIQTSFAGHTGIRHQLG